MLGTVAYNLKRLREAAEAFRAATILVADSAPAQVKYGMILRINGDYVNSEKALLKAVSVSKDAPIGDAFWQLGLLYDKLGRYADAATSLEKYLKIEPDASNKQQIRTLIATFKAKAEKKPA